MEADEKKNKKSPKNKALRIIGIVVAWVTFPIIGGFILILSILLSTSGGAVLNDSNDNVAELVANIGALPAISMSVWGIVILSVLGLICWNFRKISLFKHWLIGACIGLGIYLLMFVTAFGDLYRTPTPTAVDNCASSSALTTPMSIYRASADAIVPIVTESSFGTGFAVNDGSTIVTAYHVVEGAKSIKANYASGAIGMKVVKTAPQYDLALLKLSEPTDSWYQLSTSYDVGDEVLANGYANNAYVAGTPTLSAGIVSRVLDTSMLRMTDNRIPEGLEIIQTDAAANPGVSGGPLIGACGVIGAVVASSDTSGLSDYFGSVSEQGINYAVSAKTIKEAFDL